METYKHKTSKNTVGPYKEKISSNLRNELVDYYKPHNQKLYDFLGKSFDWDK